MSRLVRLYPQAWRDRYEAEFVALLEERPPTARDVLDTFRGAVDAHLHPHLAGGVGPSPWTHRIPGLLALAGGATWSAFIVMIAFQPESSSWPEGLIMWSVLLMFLSLPGDYMAAHGRQIAIALGLIGASIVVASLLEWGWQLFVVVVTAWLIAFVGMLTLAAIRAEIGTGARWVLVALVVGLPVAFFVPAALGVVTGRWQALASLLPYGLAWVAIGGRLTLRGSPTFVAQPIDAVGSEVRPA
jgi:hypothetical protein